VKGAGGSFQTITSGALPTASYSSGVAQQNLTGKDIFVAVEVTATTIAGTCAIALSPDGTTYTTIATLTPAVNGAAEPYLIPVPAGWYTKLTFSNATVTNAVYF
jgi:hypothetical protein